ncbi:cell wall-binding repeat-containing protein [Ornithinimicrobium cavernae]|uniref:cell wall-binding repeat-containing protein n=1 Tax=Ornithinimicrobium cavernae TaxID=2666047 RepID=UPI00137A2D7D|nr:cell wall-binding repeat-containing protein [Ornithinimicrobium cavernae]
MPRSALTVLSAVALAATVSVAPVLAAPQSGQTTSALPTASTSAVDVDRLAGENRYATAAHVAKKWTGTVDRVYVVSGHNFPDSLVAGARAGVFDAPVLLTKGDHLPSETVRELDRLSPTRITVIGGTSSVSDGVLKDLRAFAGSEGVERVVGADRYATSAKIAARYKPGHDRVFLASGETFPDALSAAAVAGTQQHPLMLTRQGRLPASVAAQLERLAPDEVVIVGGRSAISDAVAAEAASRAGGEYRRVSGADRYRTSAAVAKEFSPDLTPGYVASGDHYADALVVSGLAGRHKVPVVLTRSDHLAEGSIEALAHLDPDRIFVAGGPAAVSDGVVAQLKNPGTPPPPPEDPVEPAPPAPSDISGGFYNGMGAADDEEFIDMVGGMDPGHVVSYYNAGNVDATWPSERDLQHLKNGTTVLMGMASKNWKRGGDDSYMAWSEIAAGAHDDEIRAWGQKLAGAGGNVWFAFDIEPDVKLNQGIVPTHWKPSDFAAASRRISTIMGEEAPNVKFVFWVGGTQKGLISEMYPGDEYVDTICWDPYVTKHRSPDTTPRGLWSEFKNWLDDQPWGDRKTIGLCETGYHNGHPDAKGAQFWEQAPEAAEDLGLSFVTYFNRDSSAYNYTMDNMPLTRRAYADAMEAIQN